MSGFPVRDIYAGSVSESLEFKVPSSLGSPLSELPGLVLDPSLFSSGNEPSRDIPFRNPPVLGGLGKGVSDVPVELCVS